MTRTPLVPSKPARDLRVWLTIALGLACFLGGVFATRMRRAHASHPAARGPLASAPLPEPAAPAAPEEVLVLHSSEVGPWLRAAVAEFERQEPGLRVRLESQGTLDAERAIVAGQARPTAWIPADSSALSLLERDWRASHGDAVLEREGPSAPVPLVLSPMVFAVWSSRARVLAGDASTLSWARLLELLRSRASWSAAGGNAAWGELKLGHADPLRSFAGLQTLVLLAYGWHGHTSRLRPEALEGAAFLAQVRELERAVPSLERGAASAGDFALGFAQQGPGRYDLAVLYEAQAIAAFETAQRRWGEPLRVLYPPIDVLSDHPLCVLTGPWVSSAQRERAARLAAHLRSTSAQSAAVRFGFRPAEPDVAVLDQDPQNPFARFRANGLRVTLGQLADPPSPAVLDALQRVFRRGAGR